METITFHSYRGGVGKTLLSVNTSVKLAILDKKVCLIDFDLRAPSIQSYLPSDSLIEESNKKTLTEFLVGNIEPGDVLISTKIPNFDCVLSGIEVLQQPKVRTKLTQHGEGRILAKLFEFIRYCSSQNYDFLIIDCMPGITFRSLDALVVSDKVMIVTRPVKSEIKGLNLLISECYSKLEGVEFYAIMNQIEYREDISFEPNPKDVRVAEKNIQIIWENLSNNPNSIPIRPIYSFRRIPFVTERIYVLKEKNHSFSQDIEKFCNNLLASSNPMK
ncbi:MAG: ParA family protein [Candidatus Hodarchaeota archaeon]